MDQGGIILMSLCTRVICMFAHLANDSGWVHAQHLSSHQLEITSPVFSNDECSMCTHQPDSARAVRL